MFGPDSIYSLDIETDTSGGGGLDPHGARITEIAVKVAESLGGGEVFALEADTDEAEIALLTATDSYLKELPPGLLSTWNGSFFDLPFISDRNKFVAPFLSLGLRMKLDPQIQPKYDFLAGHSGGYSAIWKTGGPIPHQHLDISQAYRKFAESFGVHPEGYAQAGKPIVPWSLKPVCKALGIDMIEIDRENAHLYTPEERKAYCLSDGHGTRELTLRLLGLVDLATPMLLTP